MEVTRAYIDELKDRGRATAARFRETQKESIDSVLEVLEVGGGAFVAGLIHGRAGAMPTYFGVPADAGAGGLAVAAGLLMKNKHVLRGGLGVFSYWTGNLGAQVGQKMRKKTPDWKGAPMATDANGQAIGADGKPINYQVRNILAGGMPHGFAPAYHAGQQSWSRY